MNGFKNIFSNRRTNSEYLKYEDGEVITLNKVGDLDNAPRLDINKKEQEKENTEGKMISNISAESKWTPPPIIEHSDLKPNTKRFTVFSGIIVLLILFMFVGMLSKSIVNTAQDYLGEPNVAGNDSPGVSNNDSNSSTIPPDKNVSSGGLMNQKPSNNLEKPVAYSEIGKLLSLAGDSHSTVMDVIAESTEAIKGISEGTKDPYILNGMINRLKIEVQTSYKKINSSKELFAQYGEEELYYLELRRYDNLLDFLSNLNKTKDMKIIYEHTNTAINIDNQYISKQIGLMEGILKKYKFPYISDGEVLKWEVPQEVKL